MSGTGPSRRSVLSGGATFAVAAVAGFVVAHNSDAAKPKKAGSAANAYGNTPDKGGKELAKVAAVPEGGGLILDGVVLTKDSSGTVHGFSTTCTHQGCPVGSVEKGVIICPCHSSHFDITTGAPVAGPATEPLPKVEVVVQGDGIFTS